MGETRDSLKSKMWLSKILILTIVFSILSLLFAIPAAQAISPTIPTSQNTTHVSATVPSFWWLELTGWTSPGARVELSMQQIVKRVTIADKQGRFTFIIALPRNIAPFCLIATDISQNSSHPLCLPTPQESNILIKEIVMPPTINLSKGKMALGETVSAEGYTTPNSEVVPYLFSDQPKGFASLFSLTKLSNWTKEAFAAELPKPIVRSDQNGHYQFNLPTSRIGKGRIFVGSIFLGNPSPKSNTLVFNILSFWQMILDKIWMFILGLLGILKRSLLTPNGTIAAELLIIAAIVCLIFFRRKLKTDSKHKAYLAPPPSDVQNS